MLDQITPIIFAHNEAPNIGRVLVRLSWARDMVMIDSFSDDETLQIVKQFSNARILQRRFDSAASQLNHVLDGGKISTDWVLVLDADHLMTEELISEMKELRPAPEVTAYRVRFIYYIDGEPLRRSIYPPRVALFRTSRGRFEQDGHTQRAVVEGKILDLKSPLLHDDRKPFSRWLASQARYAELEAGKLSTSKGADLSWPDRIRKTRVLAPIGILFYCLFAKGLILDGWRGIYYSFQRMLAELVLSLRLIERDLQK